MNHVSPRLRGILLGIGLAIRLVLGAVFLTSALAKLRQPFDFLDTIYSYRMIGPSGGLAVAVSLPWIELVVAICLLLGVMPRSALVASIALSIVFVYAQSRAISAGLNVPCGCFGSSTGEPATVSNQTLVRAAGVLLASLTAYLCDLVPPDVIPSTTPNKAIGDSCPQH